MICKSKSFESSGCLAELTVFLIKANLFKYWISSLLAYSKPLFCNSPHFSFTISISFFYWTFPISKKHDVTVFDLLYHALSFNAVHGSLFLVHFPTTSLAISSQCPLLYYSPSSQSLKLVTSGFSPQPLSPLTSCMGYGNIQFHCFKFHLYVEDSQILSPITNSFLKSMCMHALPVLPGYLIGISILTYLKLNFVFDPNQPDLHLGFSRAINDLYHPPTLLLNVTSEYLYSYPF